jgi:Na+-driven multidrug efflux pump
METTSPQDLTLKRIFVFWVPLAATWLMMSVEGPFLAAIIARLTDPKYNLAAYGVAFSFALIIEAPIIMIMSASTALVKDWDS